MRIAIDARPLAHTNSGIGVYLSNVLSELEKSDHEILLYLDRPVDVAFDMQVRTGDVKQSKSSTPFAQVVFPRWASQDNVDMTIRVKE